MFKLRELLHTV